MSIEDANPTTETPETSADEAKIRVEGVRKVFGRIVALDDIDLEIESNQIFALIGDNGAGKSTLMNILSGVHEPTAGQVYYDGDPVQFNNPSDARDRGIETVYQDLALMNDLDVATNIFMGSFPTRSLGPLKLIDWGETYDLAERIIQEKLDRDLNLETEVEFFSGGERQLIAVGRALAFDPDVIILDEPTSALSVDATNLVHETLRNLREQGLTIIIVSHSMEDVLDLADQIGILYHGELVEVTTPDDADLETLTNLIVTGQRGD